MCGFTHPDLLTELIVESPAAFQSWLDSLPTRGGAARESSST
jgi:heme/copper-type cytochrome/quinol oxidase subunit 2